MGKTFIRYLVFPLLVLAALALTLYSLRLPDESLQPEAERVLSEPPVLPPADHHNLYFAVLGFRAAPTEDIWQAGMQFWLAASDRHRDTMAEAPHALALHKAPPCPQGQDCLITLAKNPGSLLQDNAVQLERYRQLRKYPAYAIVYADTLQANTPLPRFQDLPHEIWRIDTARRILAGDPLALQEVAQDLRFWFAIAQNADHLQLISIVHRAIQADYLLLAETAPSRTQALAHWRAATLDIPSPASDLRLALRGEGYRLGWALRELPLYWPHSPLFADNEDPLIRTQIGKWLYQPKASVNLALENLVQAQKELALAPEELARLANQTACISSDRGLRAAISNYSGHEIVCANLPNWRVAGLTVLRTQATLRLLKAQLNLIQTDTSARPETLRNPFDGQAAQKENGRLVFNWPGQPISVPLP